MDYTKFKTRKGKEAAKAMDDVLTRFAEKMELEIENAFFLGMVEALRNEGYSISDISVKIGKPESAVRNYVKKLEG